MAYVRKFLTAEKIQLQAAVYRKKSGADFYHLKILEKAVDQGSFDSSFNGIYVRLTYYHLIAFPLEKELSISALDQANFIVRFRVLQRFWQICDSEKEQANLDKTARKFLGMLKPFLPRLHFLTMVFYLAQKDFEKAVKHFEKIQSTPNALSWVDNFARFKRIFRKKDFALVADELGEFFSKLLKLVPDEPIVVSPAVQNRQAQPSVVQSRAGILPDLEEYDSPQERDDLTVLSSLLRAANSQYRYIKRYLIIALEKYPQSQNFRSIVRQHLDYLLKVGREIVARRESVEDSVPALQAVLCFDPEHAEAKNLLLRAQRISGPISILAPAKPEVEEEPAEQVVREEPAEPVVEEKTVEELSPEEIFGQDFIGVMRLLRDQSIKGNLQFSPEVLQVLSLLEEGLRVLGDGDVVSGLGSLQCLLLGRQHEVTEEELQGVVPARLKPPKGTKNLSSQIKKDRVDYVVANLRAMMDLGLFISAGRLKRYNPAAASLLPMIRWHSRLKFTDLVKRARRSSP